MSNSNSTVFTIPNLSHSVFEKLSEFVHKQYGIKLPQRKHTMVQGRLQKRLLRLGFKSFEEYWNFISSPQGSEEIVQMIDSISTNKTDFFREPAHFDYLIDNALPGLILLRQAGFRKRLLVWSAGCSSGEESDSIAMVLDNFARQNNCFNFHVLATDISTSVLKKAREAIYSTEKAEPIPNQMKKAYLMKSKDRSKNIVRIVPELRAKIQFNRLNFMDKNFGMLEPVEIIFCRIVVIYFDRQTQETLLNKFYDVLAPVGYLFLGHSESINGLDVPFVTVAPTIYQRREL